MANPERPGAQKQARRSWWDWAGRFASASGQGSPARIEHLADLESRVKESERRIRERLEKHGELLRKLERQQEEIIRLLGPRGLDRRMSALERASHALLRAQYLTQRTLPMPQALLVRRFGILSQNEEDGIIVALFDLIGSTNRRFVELGSGTNGGNSGMLALECGWSGLMLDGSDARIARVRERFRQASVAAEACWITRENVNEILQRHGFIGEIDLVSIDLDGIDYWLWDALDVVSPRVVVAEYNARFGFERAVTVPYDPQFNRHHSDEHDYYGASLQALTRLAARRGYRLIALEPRGVNAFFVRDDAAADLPTLSVPQDAPPVDPAAETLYAACERLGLPLVEVPD